MNSSGWYGQEAGFGGYSGGGCGGYNTYAAPTAAYDSGGFDAPWSGAQGIDNGGMKGGKDSKGGGKGMCKFFQEGRCTRGNACAFSHGDGSSSAGSKGNGKANYGSSFWQRDEPVYTCEDPDLLEIEAAIAKAQGEKSHDDDILEHLEDDLDAEQERANTDDGGSSSGDPLPPPASEAEIEEAQRIVQKAQEELAERNKMKAKLKDGMAQSDLQAMINARLAKKNSSA
mmetsp:Transcript_106118/g.167579  ORF Transcript_106118/g.167579 Transcript_106118/m.167579 type:complete len:228 (-) Transcript_106118:8-691(-)|eukprot:CAMPEP_0169108784 /NCGR_PEP_ID=MMETSP1015-20121227/25613_1 /TAXON_ID=342587 /ORGANISM="Karlodinium micrum, Strain CCMP2283" /LENGTH=227 /DNA_ID=CAMNT_0009170431 /DNA_START=96 /DNA_END=776 /DNA_ORIENTATION=+